jgi:hypothetical protein
MRLSFIIRGFAARWAVVGQKWVCRRSNRATFLIILRVDDEEPVLIRREFQRRLYVTITCKIVSSDFRPIITGLFAPSGNRRAGSKKVPSSQF